MPRFVLLRHDCPADYRDGPHWDLMLERPELLVEHGDAHRLATWSLLALPEAWTKSLGRQAATGPMPLAATRLPDHRAVYLTKEGPIGSGRGSVERWASGEARWRETSETLVIVELEFAQAPLLGVARLEAVAGDAWRLEWSD